VRRLALLLAAGAALAAPAGAWAHASLLRTVPEASRILNVRPEEVTLRYTEPVAPRFAIVSVTDAAGRQVTAGRPGRAADDPTVLTVPLRPVPEGWYLVYWRVVSADGHPVRGAFTFALGPNPGPAPEFVIPSIRETAATPGLVTVRTIVFVLLLVSIGLFVLRALIARPCQARLGLPLRGLSAAWLAATALALLATPVYLVATTAQFSLRSWLDLGGVLPLLRDSSFGRSLVDLEAVLALFLAAGAIALWLDRPERGRRSAAALLALWGALGAAGAALLVPGLDGHAATTSPRGLTLPLDWLHLACAAVWIGGLAGLLVLWRLLRRDQRVSAYSIVVPRFSNVAFASVVLLVGTGIGASLTRFPTLDSLWTTSYGKSLILKLILLGLATPLAAVNMRRNVPRLRAAAGELGLSTALLLRRLAGGETVLAFGAVFGAALLTSLPPPPKALGAFHGVSATVGPGPVQKVVERGKYRLAFRFEPNRAAVPNVFGVRITRNGKPLAGADVTATFSMLDMEMGTLAYNLPERQPGYFARSAPALVMVGRWGLAFDVRPAGGTPFQVLLVDRAAG
jgi:copper transport protein